MQELLDKRRALESELGSLEKQIFDLETNYIEETQNTGNIIKGWDGFLTNKSTKAAQVAGNKKIKCNPSERIFSLSSYTSPAAKALEEESERSVVNGSLPSTYHSKRNKKKKNYAKITDSIYREPKREDIFGYDDDDKGNESGDNLRHSAKISSTSKHKSDRKKISKKLKQQKSIKKTKL